MTRSRTVTTTGTGSARVVPDSAVVRVAVGHRADGVIEAFAGVDSAARVVGKVAREFTQAARISSSGLSVWPAYDNQGNRAGFEARHAMSIGCADLASAGSLLTELARQVGDRLVVDGVSLEMSDNATALVGAREAAFADARQRAEHLAGLSGESLGPVLSIVEGDGSGEPREGVGLAFAKEASMAIEPGETGVGASLTVTWEFA
jgi:uncharacterized protein